MEATKSELLGELAKLENKVAGEVKTNFIFIVRFVVHKKNVYPDYTQFSFKQAW